MIRSRFLPSLLLPVLALAACQAAPPTEPRASKAPAAATPRPAPSASAKPSAAPLGTPSAAAPVAAPRLAPPPGGGVKLVGALKVDPTYMVAAGAGNLVAAGGGNLVAAGAGNILSHNGGTAIASGGKIIAEASGNAIATTGADLVAAGSLNMVAAGGGNIVAAGGGNLVAAGAGNYGLFQAAGGPPARDVVAAPGGRTDARSSGQVPAAGMLVSVVSLTSRQYLPLGVDPQGQPVYAVYSNTQGGFEVHLPAGTDDANVMVVASIPGTQDPGLIYNAVTPTKADAETALVDEDAATVTRYLRQCFLQRLADILVAPDTTHARTLIEEDSSINGEPAIVSLIQGMVEVLHGYGATRGIPAIADPKQRREAAIALATVVTDAAFSAMDLAQLKVEPAIVPRWNDVRERLPGFGPSDGYAVPVLRAAFRELRERADKAMRQPDGSYKGFDETFFLQTAIGSSPIDWEPKPPLWDDFNRDLVEKYDMQGGKIRTYPIGKPSQVGDFLVAAYLGVGRSFVFEPVLTAYMQLDPAPYPPGATIFEQHYSTPVPPAKAAAWRANAARMAVRWPQLDLSETAPLYNAARRDASRGYARSFELVGFTLFAQLAFNLPVADSAVGLAVAEALTAYDARKAGR